LPSETAQVRPDPRVVAIVSDAAPGTPLPVPQVDDLDQIGSFIHDLSEREKGDARHVQTAPARVDTGYYFHNTGNMEIKSASKSLAALAHETRLAVFRLLVQAGPGGINAGKICEKLEIPAATLSFHLAHLSRTGLICARQEGRFIFYVADYAAMDELLAFLTDNCCQGAQCLPKTTGGTIRQKRRRTASGR
jgi:DNA-binding transcriptional ArsR family regulator